MHTDSSTTVDELANLMPVNYVVSVEPPADASDLEILDSDGLDRLSGPGIVTLTPASRRALAQIRRDDMRTFNQFEDFEAYVRSR